MSSKRTCYKCHRIGGAGPRELRPYGPGGQDLCAGCMFGEDGNKPDPEVEEEAKRQFTKRLLAPGPLFLDSTEQVGPRPLLTRNKNN